MFAFLLVVPFNTGWKQVDGFERDIYFGTLLLITLAAVLLPAPPIHIGCSSATVKRGF
jgi:Family of unknown function (DUF6328)